MKALFIGDIHIKHSNVKEIETLTETIANMRKFALDFIIIAGDVLDAHEKIDSQLMNRAYKLVQTLKSIAPTFILVGNHDYINNQQFLTENHWMNGMKEWLNVFIIDKPMYWSGFTFVPYVFPGRLKEALDTCDTDWKLSKCIFAHQEIRGCKMGAITSMDGDEWLESWPQIISGHVHERQIPQKNVYYPGSVLSHAFGYDSQGLSIFTFSGGDSSDEPFSFEEEKINLGIDIKRTLFINVTSDVNRADLKQSNRFSVCGSTAEIAGFKKSKTYTEMRAKNIKVVFRLKEEFDAATPKYLSKQRTRIKRRGLFSSIITELIRKENDQELINDYTTISI
jgi:DNA repair exonuclease SbcCD nuclease subunit